MSKFHKIENKISINLIWGRFWIGGQASSGMFGNNRIGGHS
jgi:hypothetical protein